MRKGQGGGGGGGGGALSACVTCIYVLARRIFVGALPQKKNVWNKWKNHFYKMKGMSLHEKGRNKKMPTPRHKVTHNPIPSYIFVSSKTTTYIFMQATGCQDVVLFALPNAFITNKQTNKQTNNMLKQNKDVGMGL